MAKVNKSAAALPDLDAAKPKPAPVILQHGQLRASHHQVEVTNGDSIASTYEVARLPSNARISKLSKLHSDGIAGLTDCDLGPENNPDALVDGAALTATASVDGASAITNADYDKKLWELAGLSSDPKEEMPIFLTINAAATATGNVVAELVYVVD